MNPFKIHPIVLDTKIFDQNCFPAPEIRGMEMEVIPPGTHVNTYEACDILMRVKQMAEVLIPLHEPRFAGGNPFGRPPYHMKGIGGAL